MSRNLDRSQILSNCIITVSEDRFRDVIYDIGLRIFIFASGFHIIYRKAPLFDCGT